MRRRSRCGSLHVVQVRRVRFLCAVSAVATAITAAYTATDASATVVASRATDAATTDTADVAAAIATTSATAAAARVAATKLAAPTHRGRSWPRK